MRDHPDARKQLDVWVAEVQQASWKTPHQLKQQFPKASLIGDGRVVFNIRGNRYRLDARIDYQNAQVVVVRIGTHAEYDGWTF